MEKKEIIKEIIKEIESIIEGNKKDIEKFNKRKLISNDASAISFCYGSISELNCSNLELENLLRIIEVNSK